MEIATYGFDPGLGHGAILHCVWELTEKSHKLVACETVSAWIKKDKNPLNRLHAKSTPLEISQFVHKILPMFSKPAISVGIEYDPNSVYWRTQKSQIVTLAFMLGALCHGLQSMGLPTIFIKPHQVKSAFGILPKETKDQYRVRPLQMVDSPKLLGVSSGKFLPDLSDDEYDALMIAYIAAVGSFRSQNG